MAFPYWSVSGRSMSSAIAGLVATGRKVRMVSPYAREREEISAWCRPARAVSLAGFVVPPAGPIPGRAETRERECEGPAEPLPAEHHVRIVGELARNVGPGPSQRIDEARSLRRGELEALERPNREAGRPCHAIEVRAQSRASRVVPGRARDHLVPLRFERP